MFSRHSQTLFIGGVLTCTSGVPFIRPLSGCIYAHTLIDTRHSTHLSTSPSKDQRSRLSNLWAPSGGIAASVDEDAHSKLIRAGFIRQAHSGIFHMLPLGHRVQIKIERLIDKHMQSLGASRLDLSSISSEKLWKRSGRLLKKSPELFQFKDRKSTNYLLSPTHEEEITALVGSMVKSFKELPIRLYQISRKYRDELRPRHGLLRSREFVMKDLYTFDDSTQLALATYEQVRAAYAALFSELKIPYLVAEADSGDMGGNLSHEFHFLTSHGEDHVISCGKCDYVANEEVAKTPIPNPSMVPAQTDWLFIPPEQLEQPFSSLNPAFTVWRGLSKDRLTLVNVWHPVVRSSSSQRALTTTRPGINMHAIKSVVPEFDSGVESAASLWLQNSVSPQASVQDGPPGIPAIINLVDSRLPTTVVDAISAEDPSLPLQPSMPGGPSFQITSSVFYTDPSSNMPLNLLRIHDGDTCPRCGEDEIRVQIAIELGHTFFLGTRYSEPFDATVSLPPTHSKVGKPLTTTPQSNNKGLMQMGCHGIGVSRMIGAVAETLVDEKGLNWPRVIAPYEVVVVPGQGNEADTISIYDALVAPNHPGYGFNCDPLDVVLDDRAHPFAWKMRDSDLIGYPVIVVAGKSWRANRSCEVQCRRLGVRENVPLDELGAFVRDLLDKL